MARISAGTAGLQSDTAYYYQVVAQVNGNPATVSNESTDYTDPPNMTPVGETLSVMQGQQLSQGTVLAYFADDNPADVAGNFQASVGWGVGGGEDNDSAQVVQAPGGFDVVDQVPYGYADAGNDGNGIDASGTKTDRIVVSLTDDQGNTFTADSRAVITPVPLAPSPFPFQADTGQPYTYEVATFVGGNASKLTATINWGDGTSSPGAIAQDLFVQGAYMVTENSPTPHTYAAPATTRSRSRSPATSHGASPSIPSPRSPR